MYCSICIQKEAQAVGRRHRTSLWLGVHDYGNAALELFYYANLHGLSERRGCEAAASRIFAFQFDKGRTKYSNYNTSV